MPTTAEDDPTRDTLTSVGGYRLLRLVGEGAMSSVYSAYDTPGLRHVAVKVLADHLAGHRPFVNRFYREARLSGRLSHPNIVRGLDHGFDRLHRKHFLVLEFVDGLNASDWIRQHGLMPIGAAIRVGVQIAHALRHLHDRGYVHRDVKPENVLIGQDGLAKLADLGLAKRLAGDSELTATNQGVGTPHYMPYEQAVNGEFVDNRSDLFALGATLYHLLTGRLPFLGETHEEIVREKGLDAYCPARDSRAEVPPVLDLILARAMARDPRARFPSAEAMAAALSAVRLPRQTKPLPVASKPPETVEQHSTDRTHPELTRLPPPAVPVPPTLARVKCYGAFHAVGVVCLGLAALLGSAAIRYGVPEFLTHTSPRPAEAQPRLPRPASIVPGQSR